MSFWHENYFEVKATEKQQTEESSLSFHFLPNGRAQIPLSRSISLPPYQEEEVNSYGVRDSINLNLISKPY